MDRTKCIGEVIESLRKGQRATCGRMAKVPGAAVTPSQWALLNLLYGDKGANVKELSAIMDVTGSAITQLANELEEKGYVRREHDPKDKRTVKLMPTAKCNKMMAGIQKLFAEECALMFAKLSDSELKVLNELHKKITAGGKT
ncbi:hypothetical protein A2837_01275 [Candidatus Kaiserbacteria bacterium RIFCSPHIGHO2_01_FULL_46_22]|uniref:HTH marR-type domain-containing protein n=1 Tax=Candidatus Kaiserbacteria bacterium RIFCSPHIGHO2_01_FULL_46_22 TaxID=1798475 RepID=A0A1F6BZ89_9BACT|nr:MAG: hypothetical protein A2837_01275 [Candidatus Kaiserbacteria bacterium RIFCSPHIGHO2_01_FULL_46_22]